MSYKIARGRVPTDRTESASKPTGSHKTASRRTDPRAAANTTAQPHTPSPTASVRR